MKINAEFSERALVHSESEPWVPSPMAGVSRRPLDRVGDEVARATTIVRYDPGSEFSPHIHTGGEEFVVLDGVFQDEHGDYPAGSYVRNPPQSSHKPGSAPGCIIFVKLWQFEPEDRTQVSVQMNDVAPVSDSDGVRVSALHKDQIENVAMIKLNPDARYQLDATNGAEVLVIDGSIREAGDTLIRGSWLRSPVGSQPALQAGGDGAQIWVKTGNLNRIEQQIKRLSQATDSSS
jgi:anti-sigma factor ChrR (cupin superfamily)